MNSFLIDTNCLISYVTDRAPEQQEKVSRIIEEASNLRLRIHVISNVITEFVYTLQGVYHTQEQLIAELIDDLLETPGIEFQETYNVQNVLAIWPKKIRDYGDAVLAAAAMELSIPVLTFDKRLSRQLTALKIGRKLL